MIKYFEHNDNYYVAHDKESCVKFIVDNSEETHEEVLENLQEVSEDTRFDYFVVENLESLGFSSGVYARLHNVSLKEIYTIIYQSESKLPIQVVYEEC